MRELTHAQFGTHVGVSAAVCECEMLYLVGLGLGDARDITARGLEIVKRASRVYLEAYTSILTVGRDELEAFYGRELILADRETVEQNADSLLDGAREQDVAFLVVGDPLSATTHTNLILRAVERSIPYQVIHNASILTAVGCCGLQLYHFGETVSIPFWTETWEPDSFLDKIEGNLERGLHTLCLLDIKVKEQSVENMMRGRDVYEPPRYMTVGQASLQLTQALASRVRERCPLKFLSADTLCVGVARAGTDSQAVCHAPLRTMTNTDMGEPLQSLVIAGKLHPLEERMLSLVSRERTQKSLK